MKFELIKRSVKRIHNVDDEDYFGEKYQEYVSNSSLRYINPDEGGSPWLFKNRETINSSSLELGSALHKMILEGDKYILSEVDKPNGKLGNVIDIAYQQWLQHNRVWTKDECISVASTMCGYFGLHGESRVQETIEKGMPYLNFLIEKGRSKSTVVLSTALKARLERAMESIKSNRDILDLISPSDTIFNVKHFREDVIVAEVKVNRRKVKVKCKCDSWSIDFDNKVITLNDLKSTGASIQGFMGRHSTIFEPDGKGEVVSREEWVPGSFQKWHYHRQMGMYCMLLAQSCANEWKLDLKEWTIECNMIVAETIAPYNAYSFKVTEAWLDAGRKEMVRLLDMVAWHEENGWDKIRELHDEQGRHGEMACGTEAKN